MIRFHNVIAATAILASLSLSSAAAIYPSPTLPATEETRPATGEPEASAVPSGAVGIAAPSSNHSRRDTIKVLAIGNSFSTDALHDHIHEIAAADGQPMVIGNMYIGGCTLEKHWDCASHDRPAYRYGKQDADGGRVSRPKTTLLEALVDEDWDYITMQQGGGLYGIEESYQPYLSQLKEYVLAHATNPDVKLAMHQIWALPENSVTGGFCMRYYGSMKDMYEANVAAARHWQEAEGMALVIPTGTALRNLQGTFVSRNVYRDAHHLSYTLGRYTAALTWYEALTGHDVTANAYEPPYITPLRRELARKCAHAAVQCPDRATPGIWEEPGIIALEEDVPAYTLPDPLLTAAGERVESVDQWESVRRPELLELFTQEMFGQAPEPSPKQHYEVLYEDHDALGGLATRKEVNVYFTEGEDAYLTLMIYTPNDAAGPVPVFLGVNFKGNWSVSAEEGILMPPLSGNKRHQVLENRERGVSADAWPLEMILKAGYGVATYYRGDTCPDVDSDFNTPLHRAFNPGGKWKHPADNEWGCIAAWSWGLSRCLDYMETDESVDASRVAVLGHSRLGKTALWAGATDPRFALVISNCSGSCGAAITRRHFGETVEAINNSFPHWFCGNYDRYGAAETDLPFDQHELLALVAPRPLYVASATLDGWADPHGEFISACEVSRVYDLYGVKGLVGTDGREVTAAARKVAGAGSRDSSAGRVGAGAALGLAGTGWSRRAAGRLIKAAASANARAGRIVSGSTLTDNPADLSRNVVLPCAGREIEALKYAAMPEPDQPLLGGTVAYHIHTGPHAITAFDWQQYITFADRFLK